jgi:hypothetical protein
LNEPIVVKSGRKEGKDAAGKEEGPPLLLDFRRGGGVRATAGSLDEVVGEG